MAKKRAPLLPKESKKAVQFTRKLSDGDARIRQADRLARPLTILKLVADSKRWTKENLANELGCSTKTVERTLKVLELAGIPIIQDAKTRSYRVQDNCLIPPVTLSAEEYLDDARTAAVSKFQTVAKPPRTGSLRTAKTIIPDGVRSIVETASALTSVLEIKNVDHSHSADVLRTIQIALATNRQLEAEYFSPYSESTTRMSIHAYRLCFIRSAWYLIGRPSYADAPQVFRVVRIRSLKQSEVPSSIPAAFCLETFLGNAWGVFKGDTTYDVSIRFSGPAATVVGETRWHRTQSSERHPDGTVTLQFKVDGLDEIVWWLMSWAPFARVESPNELRERLVQELNNGIRANS